MHLLILHTHIHSNHSTSNKDLYNTKDIQRGIVTQKKNTDQEVEEKKNNG